MIFVLIICMVYLLAGWILMQHALRPLRLSDVPLVWLMVSFFLFYGTNLTLGWALNSMHWGQVAGLGIFWLIVAFGVRQKHSTPAFSFQEIKSCMKNFSRPEVVLFSLFAVLLLWLFVVGYTLPYRIWDTLGYHAQNFISWAMTGEFTLSSFGEARLDFYGGAAETYNNVKAVLPFLILDLTGSDQGTALAQWPFLPLAAAAMLSMGKRSGLPNHLCALGILCYVITPEILIQSSIVYSDVAFAGGLLSLCAVLLILFQDKTKRSLLLLCAIGFFLTTGMKPTGIPVSVPLGILFLILVWKGQTEAPLMRKFTTTCGSFFLVVIVCLFTSGLWNLHAWSTFGNPVYPVSVGIGDLTIFEGVGDVDTVTLWSEKYTGKKDLAAWWWVVSETQQENSLSSWHSGTGAFFFILGIPALLFFALNCIKGTSSERFLLLLFVLICLGHPNLTFPRFLMFQVFFSALFLMVLMPHFPKLLRRSFYALIFLLLSMNFIRYAPSILYRPRQAEAISYAMLSGHTDWIRSPSESYSDYSPIDLWRDIAQDTHKVGQFQRHITMFTPKNLDASMMIIRPPAEFESHGDWHSYLRKNEVTHLYIESSKLIEEIRSESKLFEMIVHRRDHSNTVVPHTVPRVESALFEVKK